MTPLVFVGDRRFRFRSRALMRLFAAKLKWEWKSKSDGFLEKN